MDGPKDPSQTGASQTGQEPAERQVELDRLAEDWITLWQSEITALAADREAAEAWAGMAQAVAALGGAWMRTAVTPPPFVWPAPFGPDLAPEPPRPAPAATPFDPGRQPGDGSVERDAWLAARLAELERRLAEIESGPGGKPANRSRPRRRKPPA